MERYTRDIPSCRVIRLAPGKLRRTVALLSVIFAGATLLAAPASAQSPAAAQTAVVVPAAPATMPTFSMTDQFDRLVTSEAIMGAPVLFLVAARDGADGAMRWEEALRGPARTRGVRVVSVADLKGAPRLLRGVIRGGFPKDTVRSILMDFSGQLGRALRGKRSSLVAVVYGADGRLRRAVELPTGGTDATLAELLLTSAR